MGQLYEDAFAIIDALRGQQGRSNLALLQASLTPERYRAALDYLKERQFITIEAPSNQQPGICLLARIGTGDDFRNPLDLFYRDVVFELSSHIDRNVSIDRIACAAAASPGWLSSAIKRLADLGHVLPHYSNRRGPRALDVVHPHDTIAEEKVRLTYGTYSPPASTNLNVQIVSGTGNNVIAGSGNNVANISKEDLKKEVSQAHIEVRVAEQLNRHVLLPLADQIDLEIQWNASEPIVVVGANYLEVYKFYKRDFRTRENNPHWDILKETYPDIDGLIDLHDQFLERMWTGLVALSEELQKDQVLLDLIKPDPAKFLGDTIRIQNVVYHLINSKPPQDDVHRKLFEVQGEALRRRFLELAGKRLALIRQTRQELHRTNERILEGIELLRRSFLRIGADISSPPKADDDGHGFFDSPVF